MDDEVGFARSGAPAPTEVGQPPTARGRLREAIALQLETLAAQIGIGLAAGLLFAWLAPFDTARADAFTRTGYWIILLTSWFPISAAARLLSDHTPVRRLPRPAMLAVRYLVPIPPMMVVAGLVTRSLFEWHGRPIEIVELFLQVVVVGYALEALGALVRPRPVSSSVRTREDVRDPAAALAVSDDVPDGGLGPRLLQRAPEALRGPILCLQMEDHYVRIHTTRGSSLVLMRFGDAIDELDGAPGLKVHRSWWVARDAVSRVEVFPKGGRVTLVNGRVAPVSRPYLDAALRLDEVLRGERAPQAAV